MATLGKVESGLRGVLATVVEGGVVEVGGIVSCCSTVVYKMLDCKVSGRIRALVNQIPAGKPHPVPVRAAVGK